MDTIKYLELAVSKDASRYNMESIYRDINCMVATDGHRLHLVGGLATIDKPHFLNGLDAEFPNYTAVIPSNLREVCELKISKSEINQLKALVKFIKHCPIVKLTIERHLLTFSHVGNGKTASIGFDVMQESEFTPIGIRLDYFIDALIPDKAMMLSESAVKDKGHNPIILQCEEYSTKAVIMPCRLED